MDFDLKNYEGREHSLIKHHFLTRYLEAAAYKIIQGKSPIFNFVDAFAGPWKVTDKNFSDASFDQAIRTLEAVRRTLEKNGKTGIKIRFCFCEKNKVSANILREYAASKSNYEIHIFEGLFEDNLEDIANVCKSGFTFTFIDPTGWNIDSSPVFNFLQSMNGEFLINFMAEHVNRHAGFPEVAASIGRFLADPNWSSEFSKLPENWQNEYKILHLLKRKIKHSGIARFLPDFPILKTGENRIKMRLILGTNHPKGLEVFRNVEKRTEPDQLLLHKARANEPSLFDAATIIQISRGNSGFGSPKQFSGARDEILNLVRKNSPIPFGNVRNNILENFSLLPSDINKIMNKLKSDGLVDFSLDLKKKVPSENTSVYFIGLTGLNFE